MYWSLPDLLSRDKTCVQPGCFCHVGTAKAVSLVVVCVNLHMRLLRRLTSFEPGDVSMLMVMPANGSNNNALLRVQSSIGCEMRETESGAQEPHRG